MTVMKLSILRVLLVTFLAALLSTAYGQGSHDQTRDRKLNELADAERAFAAFTVKKGFRDGFIKYFADDGIGFGPHPEKTKEVLQKRPAPAGPRTVIFNWAPMFGDISQAGDLGYTTGPVLYTDISENPKPPRHAMYFSVWQKQADGSWKVAVDIGVNVPQAVGPINTKFIPAKAVPSNRNRKLAPVNVDDLGSLEISFSRFIAEHSMAKAYANFLSRGEFRIHRNGQMPTLSENDLIPVLKSVDSFEFIGGKVSSSNDLAFTYGKYFSAKGGQDSETGYYVHVWRRDTSGNWKLVADIQNPLPKVS
jgi:ketosteroid isomerase-like protein